MDAQAHRFRPVNGVCLCPNGSARAQAPGSPVYVCPPATAPALPPRAPTSATPRRLTTPRPQRSPNDGEANPVAAERAVLDAERRQTEQAAREAEERVRQSAEQQRVAEESQRRTEAEQQRLQAEREAQERMAAARVREEEAQRQTASVITPMPSPPPTAGASVSREGEATVAHAPEALPPEAGGFQTFPSLTPVSGPHPRAFQRPLGWTLFGVGAAAGVAGVVFGILSAESAREFGASCVEYSTSAQRAVCGVAVNTGDRQVEPDRICGASTLGAEGAALCNSHDREVMAAWILGAGGAALAVTGAVLVLTAPRNRGPAVRVSSWVDRAGGGAAARWSF